MILILSDPEDMHARLVERRLREKGAETAICSLADIPTRCRVTARISQSARPRLVAKHETGLKEIDLTRAEAVWFRASLILGLDADLSPESLEFSRLESLAMLMSIAVLLGDRFWVNPVPAAVTTDAGNGKIGHLELARRLGLAVPETLATNDPEEARAFIKGCPSGAIYKPFRRPIRRRRNEHGDEDAVMLYTTKLDDRDLERLEGVVFAPCIFQELVAKKLELRVTVMGERVFPCEIHSQVNEHSAVDFRRDHDMKNTPHVPHELPREIAEKLVALNAELGLVYGAFDLILTPDGRYVFLEVNQQGQFLWLEEEAGLPLLENFTEMLLQRRRDFECDAPLHAPGPFAPFAE